MRRGRTCAGTSRVAQTDRTSCLRFATTTRVTRRSRTENPERLDALFEKLLDFCFRKLARRDFGVTTCEVRASFFS